MHIVGFDLGKRKSHLCIATPDGAIVAEWAVLTNREALAKTLSHFGKCRVLIESSTSSEWVARHLETLGDDVIVADPNFGPMYAQADKRIKTDRRDARALLQALLLGAYRVAHRRSDQNRRLNALLSARAGAVKSRTQMINRVRAILEREGYRMPPCAAECFGDAFAELPLDDRSLELIVLPLVAQIAMTSAIIEDYNKSIGELAKTHDVARRFDEVVGIGPQVAMGVIAALEDVSRFDSADKVASCLGLVPSENTSSGPARRGRITKSGDPRARSLLVEASWSIMRSKRSEVSRLRAWALAIAARRGKSRAAVALARKLARILYAMWRDGTRFDPTKGVNVDYILKQQGTDMNAAA